MKKIFFLFVALFIGNAVTAQQDKRITPLHKFLQNNADSTLVFEYKTGWMRLPYYLLLSKKGDTLTAYTYKDLQRPKYDQASIPKNMQDKLSKNNTRKISSAPVDINVFFNVYPLAKDSIEQFWNSVSAVKPWSIKDDSVDGAGCPPVKKDGKLVQGARIFDGEEITLYLITKKQIRTLNFYAPQFYEKQCPGRAGRIAINKVTTLFRSYLK